MKIKVRTANDLSRPALEHELDAVLHRSFFMDRAELLAVESRGLVLGSGSFAVVVFHAEPQSGGARPYRTAGAYRDARPLVQEYLSGKRICYTAFLDGWLVSLVCCLSLSPEETEYQIAGLKRDCGLVSELCRGKTGLAFGAIIGRPVSEPAHISRSYSSVTDEYEFRMFFDLWEQSVLYLGDTWGDVNRYECWDRLVKDADTFCEKLLQGDEEGGRRLALETVDFLSGFRPMSIERIFWDIQTFFDAVLFRCSSGGALPEGALLRMDVSREIFESNTREQLANAVISVVHSFFTTHSSFRRRSAAMRVQAIQNYISANLADSGMSALGIAEHFGISQPLMSSQFKKYSGCTTTGYIQRKRVELAKELLVDTELTMEEVCFKTGFGSLVTLYRTFKKLSGQSPGRYRVSRKSAESGQT